MSNDYYNASGTPGTGAQGASQPMRLEFSSIAAGFAKLPALTGNANKAVVINSTGTGMTVTTGTLALAGNFATTGAYNTTLTQTASVTLTLPAVNGTLATLAGTETFSNKTLDSSCTTPNLSGPITSSGNVTTVAAQTGSGSTFVMQNSPTLTTPNIGAATGTSLNLSGTMTANAAALTTPLSVANGGIGVATITGLLKGAGTAAIVAATVGTDYAAPATASTWTAKQTFTGASTVLAAKLTNALEIVTISATAATGTINYDITTQSVLYYTTNASANWTVNLRGNGSNSLDSLMATGESITVCFLVTQGGTAFYNNVVQVDGNAVTPKWQGTAAPASGNINSVDVYQYTIVKTGSATFTVFASQTQFK